MGMHCWRMRSETWPGRHTAAPWELRSSISGTSTDYSRLAVRPQRPRT